MQIKIFKLLHDNPVEIYMMWIILIITILAISLKIYLKITDNSETYNFIKNL